MKIHIPHVIEIFIWQIDADQDPPGSEEGLVPMRDMTGEAFAAYTGHAGNQIPSFLAFLGRASDEHSREGAKKADDEAADRERPETFADHGGPLFPRELGFVLDCLCKLAPMFRRYTGSNQLVRVVKSRAGGGSA
jgi:hypothetical protein